MTIWGSLVVLLLPVSIGLLLVWGIGRVLKHFDTYDHPPEDGPD